ncbi:MAG TPA: hypothetical protein VGM90_22320 [Kofleriaceae bacterium]|jgi:hypothetical protein
MPGVLVEVSARIFSVPEECPCCGAAPNTEIRVQRTGSRAASNSATSLDIVYCAKCLAHLAAFEGAGLWSAGLLVVGLVVAIILAIFVSLAGLLALPVAVMLAFVITTRRRYAARKMCGPSCATTGKALAYLGWNGTSTALELASPTYAARFAEANSELLVNPTPRLRQLIEGLRVARLAVPTPAAAVKVVTEPPTASEWVAQLEKASGPAMRRQILVRALDAITEGAARGELISGAVRVELAPTYKALSTTGGEAQAKLLGEAIARVTADNLPGPVRDAALESLEARLRSI